MWTGEPTHSCVVVVVAASLSPSSCRCQTRSFIRKTARFGRVIIRLSQSTGRHSRLTGWQKKSIFLCASEKRRFCTFPRSFRKWLDWERRVYGLLYCSKTRVKWKSRWKLRKNPSSIPGTVGEKKHEQNGEFLFCFVLRKERRVQFRCVLISLHHISLYYDAFGKWKAKS